MAIRSDYLTLDNVVEIIREITNEPFFQEHNVFDLVAQRRLSPVFYFEGYALSFVDKSKSLYPEDFTDSEDFRVGDLEQLNRVRGYFYGRFAENIILSDTPLNHRNYSVQRILQQSAIPDVSLPNRGLNKNYDVFKKTPLMNNDLVLLSVEPTRDDVTEPSFSKTDVRFYFSDIVTLLLSEGCLDSDAPENSDQAMDSANKQSSNLGTYNEKLNERTEASYLTTIGLLLKLLTTPKGLDNKAPFQSQSTIIADIVDKKIYGQGKSTLETRFSEANRTLENSKKQR